MRAVKINDTVVPAENCSVEVSNYESPQGMMFMLVVNNGTSECQTLRLHSRQMRTLREALKAFWREE